MLPHGAELPGKLYVVGMRGIYVFEIKRKMEEGRRKGREGRKKEAEKD